MKILLLDIETAPNVAYVWSLWKENIPLQRLVDSSHMLCWSAKWYGKKRVHFRSTRDDDMHEKIHELMSEADALIHYNGNSFDIPVLNSEFLLHGMEPPAPSKQIDLYRTVRSKFKFPSNKLAYVTKALGLDSKAEHNGFDTWVGCMANDSAAWRDMKQYNIQDVVILEDLYDRLLPWIEGHPHRSLYGGDGCSHCGSADLVRRGFAYTPTRTFQRYQCKNCRRYLRSSKSLYGVDIQPER